MAIQNVVAQAFISAFDGREHRETTGALEALGVLAGNDIRARIGGKRQSDFFRETLREFFEPFRIGSKKIVVEPNKSHRITIANAL
ncbi:MAG TPA: hypothetical protein PLI07_13820, partial [Candidatus Hydrogenedentes bacterium]|nr:hypothetical protein [Candidatus Hydrogenedentota bacterium]